jgi:hypothetical protein
MVDASLDDDRRNLAVCQCLVTFARMRPVAEERSGNLVPGMSDTDTP